MREVFAGLLAGLVVLTTGLGIAQDTSTPRGSSPLLPEVVVDLAKIGWMPHRAESNREFFKGFTLGKLLAMDYSTRVIFLNEDVVVVYHAKQEGKDWRTATQSVEAFFIRARDGSLLSTRTWPTTLRKSYGDLFDSEARIIPLQDGHFLVVASKVITTYDSKLELLNRKKLEPSTDMWSAQSVDDGKAIFLRHESTSGRVTYSWLDSDTLAVRYEIPGYQARDFSARQSVYADGDSVLAVTQNGIRFIDRNQQVKTICDDPLCREGGLLRALRSHYAGWSGRNGIGIIDTERGGLVWTKTPLPKYHRVEFQFGEMCTGSSGTRFALWVTANRKALFDGVQVKSTPTILLYDSARPKDDPLVIRFKLIGTRWDSALSPSGKKLALMDGASVQIFSLVPN